MSTTRSKRWITRLALGIVLAASVVGCGWFDDPTPKVVTAQIEGAGVVQIVTSQKFVAAKSQTTGALRVQAFAADTITVNLPWQRDFSIQTDPRFFIEVSMKGEEPTGLDFRIFLDGTQKYRTGRSIAESPIRFVYLLNQAPITNVDVL